MQRTIFIFSPILILVVMLTLLVSQNSHKTPSQDDRYLSQLQTSMSPRPFEYNSEFEIAVKARPDYRIEDFLNKGYELWRKGHKKKAEDIFKTALLFDSDNPKTVKSIGQLAFLDGRFQEACNYFTHCLTLKPDISESYRNLAVALFCAGNVVSSEMVTNKALKIFKTTELGPFNFLLASIKHHEGETDLAEKLLFDAYENLGPEIKELMNSNWAVGLSSLPAFKRIKAEVGGQGTSERINQEKPENSKTQH